MIYQLLFIGAIVGSLSGLLGIGGGIILVPILKYYFQHFFAIPENTSMHMAVINSLAVMMFTSGTTASIYWHQGNIHWNIFIRFLPGLLLGALIGFLISKHLNDQTYAQCFAIFLMAIASNLLYQSSKTQHVHAKTAIQYNELFHLISLCTGMLSAIFGIGGGLIMTPYFLYLSGNMLTAIGTSSLSCLPLAISTSLIANFLEASPQQLNFHVLNWQAILNISITSISFSPLGAKLAQNLAPQILKKIFAILLILIGLYMFRH